MLLLILESAVTPQAMPVKMFGKFSCLALSHIIAILNGRKVRMDCVWRTFKRLLRLLVNICHCPVESSKVTISKYQIDNSGFGWCN